MFRNASIRTRVLAILAPLVIVLLLAAGTRIAQSVQTARQAEQLSTVAGTERGLISLISALDDERLLSREVLSGQADQRPVLVKARAATDPLLTAEGAALANVNPTELAPQVRRSVDAALRAGSRVRTLRAAVDAASPSPADAVNRYDAVIDDQVALPSRLASAVDNASTADALRATTSLEQLSQLLVTERDEGQAALADGTISPDERLGLAGVQAQEVAQRTDAAALARSAGVRVPAESPDLVAVRSAALGGSSGGPTTLRPAQWGDVLTADITRLSSARDALRVAATTGVDHQADVARRTAWLNALAAILVLALALGLAVVFARRLTEPLRALTTAAGTVRERLPRLVAQAQAGDEPDDVVLPVMPVHSHDEVGRLAVAFNEVNATSLAVAKEQAALREAISTTFVTLARRDQALLARQLTFIDTLERAEEDPEVLDDLFVLDHLATRMRRNAESLLVLAGLEGGRRLRGPLALSDVARTATSEVEDYRRVRLVVEADPAVLGHLALAAAHLIAELLENALTGSDPLTEVIVASVPGPDGSVVLTVSDEGLGMSVEQRQRAAARIADPSVTAALGSPQLGFFVVGRLARRLGAQITVRAGDPIGTVVELLLPKSALATEPSSFPVPGADPVPVSAAEVEATLAAGVQPVLGGDVVDLRGLGEDVPVPAGTRASAGTGAGEPVTGRGGVFAAFRPRRTGGAGVAPPRAPARPTQPRSRGDALTAAAAAEADRGTGAYTPVHMSPSSASGLPASGLPASGLPASGTSPQPPVPGGYVPVAGDGAPLTRRERRATETGRIPAVAPAVPAAPAGNAESSGVQYQPERTSGSSSALARRRHAAPAAASVPADGQRGGQSTGRPGQVWVTPSGGMRAVPETEAPRRRDPAEVRRLLAGYQSGVVRARSGLSAPTSIPTPVVGEGGVGPDGSRSGSTSSVAADVQEHA